MTRRERLEKRLERRQEWADKATARSARAYEGTRRIADGIPLGQPVLVGHHSERRHRRDLARINAGMARSVEESQLAKHHASKAGGLEHALERSIFDDDPDAIERLEEKAKQLESLCERLTRANKLWRKGGREALAAEFGETLALAAENVMSQGYSWIKSPFNLTSDRAEVRRCKARIESIRTQRARTSEATVAGGVRVDRSVTIDWCSVTFAEKPDRSVLEALRSAGFRWGKGSWHGPSSRLPDGIGEGS